MLHRILGRLRCRKMGGLIAASLYEPLDAAEQEALDGHLAWCAHCQRDASELRLVVEQVPREEIPFTGDLLPALRGQLAQAPARRPFPALRVTAFAASILLLAVVSGVGYWSGAGFPDHEPVVLAASPVEAALAKAHKLAKRDFMAAREALQETLAAYAGDPRVGEAQAALAELEFGHGQRYAQAYAAYTALRSEYPETWKQNPENVLRFNLLNETREADYEPLYALDAARGGTADPFGQLEELASRYPGKLVAALAVEAMGALAGGPDGPDSVLRTAALEEACERCTNPIAVAQIRMALGDLYLQQFNDPASARECYSVAADSDSQDLARLGQDALALLDSDNR